MSLLATAGAQAMVVDDSGNIAGVALVPGSTLPTGVSAVTSSGTCADPGLPAGLVYQPGTNPLCWHGGSVIHANESFALTWDPARRYWEGTRGYVEQFLRDVANGSGSVSSPYAVSTQYTDGSGRAENNSKYGGGCIDYGSSNDATCAFNTATETAPGNPYPANGCTPTGSSFTADPSSNDTCLTDAQLQQEIKSLVTDTGMLGHVQSGYTPVVVMLLPPRVEVCLDSSGTLCSANSTAAGQFCSYHSQVQMPGGDKVTYVVQPWTAETHCDEPDAPAINSGATAAQLSTLVGERLVSPISQSEIAALVNPSLDGWYAASGDEINDDNGCTPLGDQLDSVAVGSNSYLLQREYNNGAAIDSDPYTYFGCAPDVILNPAFVAPSAVDQGDVVELDGSATASTLVVANGSYHWSFGDGTNATGPSVAHAFSAAGSYPVKLTVTDRGGNTVSLAQTITVLGPGGSSPGGPLGLQVRLQLMPQALRSVLKSGLRVRLSSNQNVSGIATVSITRGTARHAHIKAGHGPSVVIGRGTISSVKAGVAQLRLHLSHRIDKKLHRLHRVTFSIRLALVGSAGGHVAIDAAGRY